MVLNMAVQGSLFYYYIFCWLIYLSDSQVGTGVGIFISFFKLLHVILQDTLAKYSSFPNTEYRFRILFCIRRRKKDYHACMQSRAHTIVYCRVSTILKRINNVRWNWKNQRTSEHQSVKVKMSVVFDSKSGEVESDDLNLIDSSYRLRRKRQFQNPGKSKHFPFIPALLQLIFTDWHGAVKRRLRLRLNPSIERVELNWTCVACLWCLLVISCDAVCWIGAAAVCLGLLLLTLILVAHSECTATNTSGVKHSMCIHTFTKLNLVGSILNHCRHKFS